MVTSKTPKEQCGISGALMRPGNKESVRKTVYTLGEAGGRAALELIDEEAQQSTKRIVTSLVANYDTSRSAP
jgi:hypothetical protein